MTVTPEAPDSDSDSSYLDSGDDGDDFVSSARFSSNLADHANRLSHSINEALDSVELDKVLAIQAKLSGQLNNQNMEICDKRDQLVARIGRLKELYSYHFKPPPGESICRVERLAKDVKGLETRIGELTKGKQSNSVLKLFSGDRGVNVAANYPVEYNRAKDKVLERQLDEP